MSTVILIVLAVATLAMLTVAAIELWVNRPPVDWDPDLARYRSARLLVKEHDGGYGPRRPRHHR